MQNLIKLIRELKNTSHITDQAVLNFAREYLQVLILKTIYQSKYGKAMSFVGGTCLRICHDLKRYSEDLDFTLDNNIQNYSFDELNSVIARSLENLGFEIDLNVSSDKIVQKSFIKIGKILQALSLTRISSQKLHIKLEIDINPVKTSNNDIETFFVTKFNEIFPILKHTDDTMFAGKIHAILSRKYTKGRDFYDLIWYLNNNIPINLKYLNRTLKQDQVNLQFVNNADVIEALKKNIEILNIEDLMKDLRPFLEDTSNEEQWISNYRLVFLQTIKKYL